MIKNIHLMILLIMIIPLLLWSAYVPESRSLWLVEILPFIVLVLVLIKTGRIFPLTLFSYISVFLGLVFLLIGAHYSYARVPLCNWTKEVFGFSRNNFDKIGHFVSGFVLAALIKEVIIRKKIISLKKWTNFVSVSFALAAGALWEIFEWMMVSILVHIHYKKPAVDYLGEQGYIWDAQSDMLFALIGAIVAIYFFARRHDKSIEKMDAFLT